MNWMPGVAISDASGFLNGTKKFDFIVFLYFWFDIFIITKKATDKVQGPCLDIRISIILIQNCIEQFSPMRMNHDHFEKIQEKARTRCHKLDIPASLDDGRKRIRTGKSLSGELSHDQSLTDATKNSKLQSKIMFWITSSTT